MNNDVLGVGISIKGEDSNFADLGRNLDKVEELDVDYVELPILSLPLVCGGQIMPGQLRKLKPLLSDRPFGWTAHGPIGINFMDENWRLPMHRQVLQASLDVAAELNAIHYVMHSGIVEDMQNAGLEAAYAKQRDELQLAGEYAAARNIVITVENAFTYSRKRLTALPSKLAAEIAAVDHPNVRACFDFSHGYINSAVYGVDFFDEALALGPFSKHLHVHDSFGRPQDIRTYSRSERLAFGQGDIHLPIGWGSIPWEKLIEKVRFHPGVIFNIELEATYWTEVVSTVAAVRRLAERARTTAAAKASNTSSVCV